MAAGGSSQGVQLHAHGDDESEHDGKNNDQQQSGCCAATKPKLAPQKKITEMAEIIEERRAMAGCGTDWAMGRGWSRST